MCLYTHTHIHIQSYRLPNNINLHICKYLNKIIIILHTKRMKFYNALPYYVMKFYNFQFALFSQFFYIIIFIEQIF